MEDDFFAKYLGFPSSGGPQQPSPVVSLLGYDPRAIKQQALYQGLTGLGMGLMQAGAKSTDPGNQMRGIAAGIGGFNQGMQGAQQRALQQMLMSSRIGEAQEKAKQRQQWAQIFGGAPSDAGGAAQAGAGAAPGAGAMPPPSAPGASSGLSRAATNPLLANLSPQDIAVLRMLGPDEGQKFLANRQAKLTETGAWESFEDPKTGVRGQRNRLSGEVREMPMTLDQRLRLAQASAARTNVSVNTAENPLFRGLGEGAAKKINESRDMALTAANSIQTISIAEDLLNKGVITGTGANFRLGLTRALATVGIGDGETVANTEAFVSTMGRTTLDLVKQLGAGAGISNADRDYAERVAGGNIEMTEAGIRRLIDINRRVSAAVIQRHNNLVEPLLKDPRLPAAMGPMLRVSPPDTGAPAQRQNQPQAPGQQGIAPTDKQYPVPNQQAISFLRMSPNDQTKRKQFDEVYGPGAAERVLGVVNGR